jgi:YVTN family beta-propeller protein
MKKMIFATCCMVLACSAAGSAQSDYKVQARWNLGGDGGWDYLAVDPQSHLLYITRGSHVMVVNTSTGKQVADIAGLKGVHGVAFDTTGKFGYISDGGANNVVVFDRATNQAVTAIEAGTNPDGIAFEPVTKTVWAFNGRSKNATVIDAATNKVIATVPLPGKPEFPAADGRGAIFVNIEDTSQIVRLNAASHTATATWPLAPCEGPSGLAMDRKGRRLFPVCDGKVMAVVNADSGKVETTVAIGDGPDAAAFDASRKLVFSSNGDGTLTIVKQDAPDKYTVLQNLPTQKSARTMALDEGAGKIYLVTAEFGPAPAPSPENPRGRQPMVPGSFTVLVVGR